MSPDSTSGWQHQPNTFEPCTFQLSLARDELLYLASDNSIISHRLHDNNEQLLTSSNALLRQPTLAPDASLYYAVRFTDNKSNDSELVEEPRYSSGSSVPIAQQPGPMFSAQFDIQNQWLLYTPLPLNRGVWQSYPGGLEKRTEKRTQ